MRSVASPREIWLRTRHWGIEREEKKKKAWHPTGIDLLTSRVCLLKCVLYRSATTSALDGRRLKTKNYSQSKFFIPLRSQSSRHHTGCPDELCREWTQKSFTSVDDGVWWCRGRGRRRRRGRCRRCRRCCRRVVGERVVAVVEVVVVYHVVVVAGEEWSSQQTSNLCQPAKIF